MIYSPELPGTVAQWICGCGSVDLRLTGDQEVAGLNRRSVFVCPYPKYYLLLMVSYKRWFHDILRQQKHLLI